MPAEPPRPPSARTSIWRLPGIMALVLVSVAGFGGFASLVSVAPLWVVHGGASEAGAGSVNTVLLLATVITQMFVPRLLAHFGHAAVLSVGLLALGLPSLALGLSDELLAVLALSAVRGIGFGILTVTGSAVVADLAPASRRGEAIGAYGLGIAVPNLVVLPFSVVVAEEFGFGWVFVAGAMPLAGLPAAFALDRVLRRMHDSGSDADQPKRRKLPRPTRSDILRLARPAAVLVSVTLAGGGLMTFLPQMTVAVAPVRSSLVASIALFVLGATGAFTRWWIGHVADRRGAGRLMIVALAVGSIGMALLAWSLWLESVGVLLLAVALVGCAYGSLQNLTLLSAFQQVERPAYGTASSVWNIGFDSGTAFGAMVLGVVASQAGFVAGVAVLGALVLAAIPLAWSLSRAPR